VDTNATQPKQIRSLFGPPFAQTGSVLERRASTESISGQAPIRSQAMLSGDLKSRLSDIEREARKLFINGVRDVAFPYGTYHMRLMGLNCSGPPPPC
jgi:hypothetical protein